MPCVPQGRHLQLMEQRSSEESKLKKAYFIYLV